MIQFNNVTKRYGATNDILNDVSFHVQKGEMTFLTGRSGAGKSTLLKLIAMLEHPSSGQIIVNDRTTGKLNRRQVPQLRRDIGIIFQNYKLLNDRTVFENVALPLIISDSFDRREIGRRVRAALDMVGLLPREKAYPLTLSGGEQQRVGIARAVVNRPLILLADEPTGNLDPVLSREIMHIFEQFNRVGVTVLVASHDVKLIKEMGYAVLAIDHAKIFRKDLV
jgi:cell division transport system ATP-binding protein